MYKLLIVDDEEEIRDGLSELIDWNSLGFVVKDRLNDGSDAIRYIQEHQVDAILTDIKMTYSSGIDLAKYAHENFPDIKIVFLSGFQEFALAKEAIRFNVTNYLLKPTDLDEVSNVFREIASELDELAKKREMTLRQSRDINSLRPLMMEQFFFNLLSGAPWGRNLNELKGRLRQSGLTVDPLHGRVSEMKAEWYIAERAIKNNIEQHTISLAITKERDSVYFTCVHVAPHKIVIIGNTRVQMTEEELLLKTEQYFTYIQITLLSLLGVSIRLETLHTFENLSALLDNYHLEQVQHTPNQTKENSVQVREEETNVKDRIIIREVKQYIMEHVQMDVTLTDVARHVSLNPVYLSRLFKLETNMNFSDYVVSIRIQKAIEHLKNPSFKVYEIGHMVGYKNTKHFHKVFKQHTNLTPSEYREKL